MPVEEKDAVTEPKRQETVCSENVARDTSISHLDLKIIRTLVSLLHKTKIN